VLRRVNAAALVRAAAVRIEDLIQDELTDSARGPLIPAAASLVGARDDRPYGRARVRQCTIRQDELAVCLVVASRVCCLGRRSGRRQITQIIE